MIVDNVFRSKNLRNIERQMEQALSFDDWASFAQKHDSVSGKDAWKNRDDCSLYDSAEIRIRYDNLRQLLEQENYSDLLYALNEGIHGNMGGMGRPILYNQAKWGTKQLVGDYVSTLVAALEFIANAPDSQISFPEKLDFFRRASHCYGRTALMMSGGAGLIYFHHGVVQTLIDQDLVPNVISGASAGSWMAAQLGTLSDKELKAGHFDHFRYDMPYHLNPLLVLAGLNEEYSPLLVKEQAMDSFCNDMTFQEAFEHSGRYINISIAPSEKHQTSRLMNAITSPNVYIKSAVDASGSIPGVLPPVTLYAKGANGKSKPYLPSRKWVDGSFAQDLPAKRLARLFGVNHHIVSMINPFAVSFIADPKLRRSRGLKSAISGLALEAVKDTLLKTEDYMSRYGASFVSPAILFAHAVLDQEYTGDVNIILDKKDFYWRNVLFSFKHEDEMENLIMAGKRSTWPKVSMIRNASVVGKALDNILEDLEQKEMAGFSGQSLQHMTAAS